jgi:hypothetical protein
MVIATPQLVTGLLPENGGGLAIAVSASENHTAVLTGESVHRTFDGHTYYFSLLSTCPYSTCTLFLSF